MTSVSIIIPTYNEAENITPLCDELFSVLQNSSAPIDVEIIFVDDNSPDGTAHVIEQLKSTYPIQVIRRAGKLGLGSAVRAGFAASTRPIIGVMDADLSHDPALIPHLVSSLSVHDISIGSRFVAGSAVENWSTDRRLLSRVGVGLARLLTKTSDPLSGYFFLHRSAIDKVPLTTTGYKILLEILVKGHHKRVAELPFRFRARRHNTSKLNATEYLLFIQQILSYTWYKTKKLWSR